MALQYANRIGEDDNSISVEFALEAKCKQLSGGSGVKETSRLISRLRHRQFGMFITTSYVSEQAYREIIEDGHPVIIVSAVDVVNILIKSSYSTVESLEIWLKDRFSD